MAKLKAGVASVDITPPVGVDMTGFGGRPSGAIGIHDPLYAKALVLDDGNTKLVAVTTDLLSLEFELIDKIRALVKEKTGISTTNIMINSSHTHSGPAAISLHGMGKLDTAYLDVLYRKTTGAVIMANDRLSPAKLGYGRGDVQIGVNRREKRTDGNMVLGINLEGAIAPYVDVLRVDKDTDNHDAKQDAWSTAIFFSHAAHPVVLGGSNVLISADYPGYAAKTIEAVENTDVAMFAQGCCGNINSNPVGGTFEDARRLGTILGSAVIGVAERIETVDKVELSAESKIVELPLKAPLPEVEAQKLVDQCAKELDRVKEQELGRPQSYLAQGRYDWANDMLKLSKRGDTERSQKFEVQIMKIGDIALIGLSGEVFVDFALELDEKSPSDINPIVLGYTNGCIGYVPTEDAYPKGGYEVDTAYKYYGTLMIKPESHKIIIEAVTSMQKGVIHGG